MALKNHTWKDMSLAPVETHLMLWSAEEGQYIGIYRIHDRWDNWYSIGSTGEKYGTYRECNPSLWMHLPSPPPQNFQLDDRGYLTPRGRADDESERRNCAKEENKNHG